jgi:hypothetical protein
MAVLPDAVCVDHPMPPAWLTGAWVRQARSFDGGPPAECSDVVWLQVGSWFADFRLPRPGRRATHPFDIAHAFSGKIDVADTSEGRATVTWRHDLDTLDHEDEDPDTARVVLSGRVLVESGEGYVEWWGRPDDADLDVAGVVLDYQGRGAGAESRKEEVTARVVCVDQMAVAVWSGPGAGGVWCSAAGDWEPRRVVGTWGATADVGLAIRAAVGGAPPPDGWRERCTR